MAETEEKKDTPDPQTQGGADPTNGLFKLDPLVIAEIELTTARRELAEANIQLARMRLQQASSEHAKYVQEESRLFALISQEVGRTATSVRLVDKRQGLVLIS